MNSQTEHLYHRFLENRSVSTDSRKIIPGSIFFALRGENFDGNRFAARAIESGAALAVVDNEEYATGERYILVPDALQALQDLAAHHRKQFDIPVIAVTGTNGKTTTKELITAVLSGSFNTLATAGNLNNHIGVPLTLLGITNDTRIAVIEMGANHPGEIEALCRIACPDHGIITNIGRAHLEGFGGFEGVVKTKTELYDFLAKNNGLVFLNGFDELLVKHSKGIRSCVYGSPGSTVPLISMQPGSFVNMTIVISGNTAIELNTLIYGSYNANNILAGVCIGKYFKVPDDVIRHAIESYQPSNNRSQVMQTTRNMLILDAYNANPSSMKAALEAFSASGHTNKSVILGDMLELGESSDEEHLKILGSLKNIDLCRVYLVGPRFTRLNTTRDFICFNDAELARLWFEHEKPENETILLKGSRGIGLERLVETL